MRLSRLQSDTALDGVNLEAVNAHIGIGNWYSDSDRFDSDEVFEILMDEIGRASCRERV